MGVPPSIEETGEAKSNPSQSQEVRDSSQPYFEKKAALCHEETESSHRLLKPSLNSFSSYFEGYYILRCSLETFEYTSYDHLVVHEQKNPKKVAFRALFSPTSSFLRTTNEDLHERGNTVGLTDQKKIFKRYSWEYFDASDLNIKYNGDIRFYRSNLSSSLLSCALLLEPALVPSSTPQSDLLFFQTSPLAMLRISLGQQRIVGFDIAFTTGAHASISDELCSHLLSDHLNVIYASRYALYVGEIPGTEIQNEMNKNLVPSESKETSRIYTKNGASATTWHDILSPYRCKLLTALKVGCVIASDSLRWIETSKSLVVGFISGNLSFFRIRNGNLQPWSRTWLASPMNCKTLHVEDNTNLATELRERWTIEINRISRPRIEDQAANTEDSTIFLRKTSLNDMVVILTVAAKGYLLVCEAYVSGRVHVLYRRKENCSIVRVVSSSRFLDDQSLSVSFCIITCHGSWSRYEMVQRGKESETSSIKETDSYVAKSSGPTPWWVDYDLVPLESSMKERFTTLHDGDISNTKLFTFFVVSSRTFIASPEAYDWSSLSIECFLPREQHKLIRLLFEHTQASMNRPLTDPRSYVLNSATENVLYNFVVN